jgi:hypothetical protein
MSEPTKEEMLEWLDNAVHTISYGYGQGIKTHGGDCYQAIRTLILAVEEWKKEIIAILANMALGNQKTQRKELANAIMLLQRIRYFGEAK